ncbi:MAG: hypothetical protein AB1505_20105, partial [Candidatus Latescibacterota bacterium]
MQRLSRRGLILALAAPVLAAAQPGPLAGGEYFVDRDPGAGGGTALTARDGSFDGTAEDVEFTVETGSLAPGSHVVYVRLQDEGGTWGRPRSAAIEVTGEASAARHTVAAAEYFIDRDPGPGRGTALAAQDGAFGGDTEGASLDISTEGLAEGYHV